MCGRFVLPSWASFPPNLRLCLACRPLFRGDMVKTVRNPITGKDMPIRVTKGSFWSEAKIIELVNMWTAGKSSREIAHHMSHKYGCDVTRNAIIGRLSRMGMTDASRKQEKDFQRRAKRKPAKKVTAVPDIPQPVSRDTWPLRRGTPPHPPLHYEEVFREVIVPAEEHRKLPDLEPYHCRWPIGDPREADFHFCCAKRVPSHAYCGYHAAASQGQYHGVAAPWPTRELKKTKVPELA